MALIKKKDGWGIITANSADPDFFWSPIKPRRPRGSPRVPKVYPIFPPIFEHEHNDLLYRQSVLADVEMVIEFVDRLLSGKDFFCPRGQHIGYYQYKTIAITLDKSKLVGWAVRQKMGSLIHLLVDTGYRGKGIGSHLLKILAPLTIRSKSDQSTGDPIKFYEKHGYVKTSDERIGRKQNIDLLSKQSPLEVEVN